MKKIFLLAAIAAITSSAIAQDQPPVVAEKKEVKQTPSEWELKVKTDLKLTDEQVEKYSALNKEYSAKIDALMKDETINKDVQKEKKMALKKEKEDKFLELLTSEQQTKYKELKAEMDKKKEAPKQEAPKQ